MTKLPRYRRDRFFHGDARELVFSRAAIWMMVLLAFAWSFASNGATVLLAQPAPTDLKSDSADDVEAGPELEALDLAALVWDSKWLMLPIIAASLLVGTVAIERAIYLRKRAVIPAGLVFQLGRLGNDEAPFDPRAAHKICQHYPSVASRVLRAMLEKVGRPHAEVESTVAEISDREAERLYANVRWLTLSATVTPLMGLLGTVWGMIRAFHDTTQLAPGQDKADYLALGIYTALVTTLGGLMVAIPAAILAHYFEGKIQSLFHQIHDLTDQLSPQLERFEGRVRFARLETEGANNSADLAAPAPMPTEGG
jgi:biopolymer transport protein ExbB